MEFSAENVEAAVKQFYMSSSGIQAQAHQWLMSAQTSKEAWSFVWPLLRQDTSPEVQFFGATTLQAKVKIMQFTPQFLHVDVGVLMKPFLFC
jgi:Importin-beta N-terminal domain